MWVLVFQRIFIDAFLDLVYFPIWWYTGGVKHAIIWCFNLFKSGNETLAPSLWLQNIFVPMFGQWDWQGRIISFFMRLAQVIGRTFALVIWFIICLALLFVWLLLPVLVVYSIYLSIIK